jgi:hypothetical protein
MRYYIGAVLRSVPNWEEYIDVKHPKNYKDPEKIAKYVAERKAELETGMVTHPLGGCITSICILDAKREIPASTEEQNTFAVGGVGCAVKGVEFLLDHSGLLLDPKRIESVFVGGCRLSATLRLMAIEYMIVNGSLPFALHWMLGDNPTLRPTMPLHVDPLRAICGYRGPHVPEIPLDKVAKKFGLPPPDEADAQEMAVFSYQLCNRLGL